MSTVKDFVGVRPRYSPPSPSTPIPAAGSAMTYSSPVSRTQLTSQRAPDSSDQSRPNSNSSEDRRAGFWS